MSGENDKQENKKKKRLPPANRSLAGSAIDSGTMPKMRRVFLSLSVLQESFLC